MPLSKKLYSSIQTFIDANYVDTHCTPRFTVSESVRLDDTAVLFAADEKSFGDVMPFAVEAMQAPNLAAPMAQKRDLNDVLARLEETFSQRLLRLIDEKRLVDSSVYKRANIDRRVFSKIRSNKDYRPSKNTALAFAIALELSLDDARDLLMKAGFALSRSSKLDVIVEYFITDGNYNIFEINEALFAFDQSLLGA